MKKSTAETLAYILGILFVAILFGGLFALFTKWILSMIIDWPITWVTGVTGVLLGGCIIVLKVIFGGKSK